MVKTAPFGHHQATNQAKQRKNHPAEGEYTLKVDRRGYPQIILFRGPDIKRRLGSWNGLPIVGYPTSTHLVSQKFVFHEKEVYYEYKVKEKVNRSVFNLYNLNSFGTVRDLFWSTQNRNRRGFQILEQNQCEDYAFCGVNSICNYMEFVNLVSRLCSSNSHE